MTFWQRVCLFADGVKDLILAAGYFLRAHIYKARAYHYYVTWAFILNGATQKGRKTKSKPYPAERDLKMSEKETLIFDIDGHTADALEYIALTHGVTVGNLARNMVESCASQSIQQGPREIVECYVEGAQLYAEGAEFCEWTDGPRGSLEKLAGCRATLERMKAQREYEAKTGGAIQ